MPEPQPEPQPAPTPARVAAYIAGGGVHCPFCGADDIQGNGGVDIDSGSASQECSCLACDATWHDQYRLVSLAVADPETGCCDLTIPPAPADPRPPSQVFEMTLAPGPNAVGQLSLLLNFLDELAGADPGLSAALAAWMAPGRGGDLDG